MSAPPPSLADPETRGEDLRYNYELATHIAAAKCRGCARYHIVYPLIRLLGLRRDHGSAWEEFDDVVDELVGLRARSSGSIAVTVVGAADTGLLAQVAHAASNAGVLERTEFLVVDGCDTPLRLCRDYGERHGLKLQTRQADVVRPDPGMPADLILVHSLLRFIPVETRAACLRQWQGWLNPGGKLVVSNTFAEKPGPEKPGGYNQQLRDLVERDAIELAEPREPFLKRLDEPSPWQMTRMTESDLIELFRQANFAVDEIKTVKAGDSAVRAGGRAIAVFEKR